MRKLGHIALLASASLVFATPALARAYLRHAEPRPGSIVVKSPKAVELDFTAGVIAGQSKIMMMDSNGNHIPITALYHTKKDPKTLRGNVQATLKRGVYEVDWHALSAGGDRTSGSFTFTYEPHPEAQPTPEELDDPSVDR